MKKLYAKNIKWDIDIDEIYEALDEMTVVEAANLLELCVERYANMSTEEKHDYAYDYFHHRHDDCKAEFLGIPSEIKIPDGLVGDDEAISDWLSDEYGWCHEGFELEWKE